MNFLPNQEIAAQAHNNINVYGCNLDVQIPEELKNNISIQISSEEDDNDGCCYKFCIKLKCGECDEVMTRINVDQVKTRCHEHWRFRPCYRGNVKPASSDEENNNELRN